MLILKVKKSWPRLANTVNGHISWPYFCNDNSKIDWNKIWSSFIGYLTNPGLHSLLKKTDTKMDRWKNGKKKEKRKS